MSDPAALDDDRAKVRAHILRRKRLESFLFEHERRRRYGEDGLDYRQRLAEDLIEAFDAGKL